MNEVAAMGHADELFRATNTGSAPCTLAGYPQVSLLGCRTSQDRCAAPHTLHAVVFRYGETRYWRDPGPHQVRLAPGDHAEFELSTGAAGFDGVPNYVTNLRVRLPSGLTGLPVGILFSGPTGARYVIGESAWAKRLRILRDLP